MGTIPENVPALSGEAINLPEVNRPQDLDLRLGISPRPIDAEMAADLAHPEVVANVSRTRPGQPSPMGLPRTALNTRNSWTGRKQLRGIPRKSRPVAQKYPAQHIGARKRETRRETEFRDALSLHDPIYASHCVGHFKPSPDTNFNTVPLDPRNPEGSSYLKQSPIPGTLGLRLQHLHDQQHNGQ
jgi:hypothetical protein